MIKNPPNVTVRRIMKGNDVGKSAIQLANSGLCTHVAFVDAGRVTRFGTIAELTADGRTLEETYLEGRPRNGKM